jgi:fructokinase
MLHSIYSRSLAVGGVFFSKLQQKNIEDCLSIAQKLASIKLQNVGRLPEHVNIIDELLHNSNH